MEGDFQSKARTTIQPHDRRLIKHGLLKTILTMNRLDAILTHLERNPKAEQPAKTVDPEKAAKLIKHYVPAWSYTDLEVNALNLMFNGSKWVLLCGNMGTGKTMLLNGFKMAHEIIYQERVIFYSTAKFNIAYGAEGEQLILNNDKGLMCLDDLGAETKTQTRFGTVIDPIATLLFLRYENKARTFCTTNLDTAKLKERYGARLSDRFREVFEVITFKGDSRR